MDFFPASFKPKNEIFRAVHESRLFLTITSRCSITGYEGGRDPSRPGLWGTSLLPVNRFHFPLSSASLRLPSITSPHGLPGAQYSKLSEPNHSHRGAGEEAAFKKRARFPFRRLPGETAVSYLENALCRLHAHTRSPDKTVVLISHNERICSRLTPFANRECRQVHPHPPVIIRPVP